MMKRLVVFSFCSLLLAACGEEKVVRQLSQLEISESSLDFGEVGVGEERTLEFTVRNGGSSPLHVSFAAAAAAEEDGDVFAVDPAEVSLTAATSATVKVIFTPERPTPLPIEGKVTITSNATGSGKEGEVALQGRGIAASLVIKPRKLAFDSTVPDRKDTNYDNRTGPVQSLTFEIRNQGSADQEIAEVAFVDDAGGAFASAEFSELIGVYAPGAVRRAAVTFDPFELGESKGSIRIRTSTGREETVELEGRGSAPVLSLCASMDDDPITHACLPSRQEDRAPGTGPVLTFGDRDDLQVRKGRVEIANLGTEDLEIRGFKLLGTLADDVKWDPSIHLEDYDIRLFSDEARTERLPNDFSATLCPPDADDCENGLVIYAEYLPRGTACCVDGAAECVALIVDSCTELDNGEVATILVTTNDPAWSSISLGATGGSLTPTITVGPRAAGRVDKDQEITLSVRNDGRAPLEVFEYYLVDPAVGDCREQTSEACDSFEIVDPDVDGVSGKGFILEPDDLGEVKVRFLVEGRPQRRIELHFSSSDPARPVAVSAISVNVSG